MTVRELIDWLNANAKPDDVVKCLERKEVRGFYDDDFVFVVADEWHLFHLPSNPGEVWIGDK